MNKSLFKKISKLLLFLITGFSLSASIASPEINHGVSINEIEVRGCTVFDKAELGTILDAHLNRTLFIEDLVELQKQLTDLYVSNGYINSGARLPEQDLSAGKLVIEIIEGHLADIQLLESGRFSEKKLLNQIYRELHHPLNIKDLQTAFSRVESQPTVEYIRGKLQPGEVLGETTLELSVFEADVFNVEFSVNNHSSPSIGKGRTQLQLSHLNLSGAGDRLFLGVGKTEGDDSGNISYSYPIDSIRSSITTYYMTGDNVIVEEPFDEIEIESETDTIGVRFTSTLINRHGEENQPHQSA